VTDGRESPSLTQQLTDGRVERVERKEERRRKEYKKGLRNMSIII
jgi:hypothetical protein